MHTDLQGLKMSLSAFLELKVKTGKKKPRVFSWRKERLLELYIDIPRSPWCGKGVRHILRA